MTAIGGKDKFVEPALATGGAPGQDVTSVPLYGLAYGLYYNKAMFAQAGLKPPTTWEEMVAAAKKLTNPSRGVHGMALAAGSYTENVHFAFIDAAQNGAEWFDKDRKPTFTGDGNVQGVLRYLDLMQKDKVANTSNAQYDNGTKAVNDFATKKVAMILNQNNADNSIVANGMKSSEYGVVALPAPAGGQPVASHVAGINLSIFKNTKNKDGALEFVRFHDLAGDAEDAGQAVLRAAGAEGRDTGLHRQPGRGQDVPGHLQHRVQAASAGARRRPVREHRGQGDEQPVRQDRHRRHGDRGRREAGVAERPGPGERRRLTQMAEAAQATRAVRARRTGWTGRARHRESRWLPYALLAPAVLLELFIHIVPMLVGIWMSFVRLTKFFIANWSAAPWAGLGNYRVAVDVHGTVGQGLLKSFAVTLAFSVLTVGLAWGLGMAAAVALQPSFSGRGAVRTLFLVPYALPAYAGILTWNFMLQRDTGAVNHLLVDTLHLADGRPFWLLGGNALASVVTVATWRLWPFAFLTLMAGMQSIPADLYEAAAVDGAGNVRQWRNITLPSLRPVNLVLVLVLFLWTFSDFNTPYVLFGTAQPPMGDLISFHIYNASFLTWNFGFGAAMSVLLLLFLLVVTSAYLLVTNRRSRRA
jgi:multiple sugar transport system permease protein